ncbi:hypothetical protein [Micropruina sp.]|uniref:hypothetical protein n=1 Tax=Micropruina sp. TaxID=2737536 RepID=UPI0039E68FDB
MAEELVDSFGEHIRFREDAREFAQEAVRRDQLHPRLVEAVVDRVAALLGLGS